MKKSNSIVSKNDFADKSNCKVCGHIDCVCRIKRNHKKDCKFMKASTCAIPIECKHGYDVCPICDPCECGI